jgi:hypothetical protein
MRIPVVLTRQEIDALGQLAAIERRPPRNQAAFLIAEGLRHRGLLPDAEPASGGRAPATGGISVPTTQREMADAIA